MPTATGRAGVLASHLPPPPPPPAAAAAAAAAAPGFDAVAIRAKYKEERDKRLRADGNGQYLNPLDQAALIKKMFPDLLRDPYAAPLARAPLRDEVDALVIGGGFGGLLTAARLREQGVNSVRIIEKGGDFGGTWYFNRYPGAQCDIESYVYLPLLEELGYVPSEKYAHAPEIFAHCRAIGEKYGLYRDACFQTVVTRLVWDAAAGRWTVETDRGDAVRARFVCVATGPFARPKLPGIAGIESFAGATFHTSRWDYGVTGGDPKGGALTGLRGKRVGVIGTGATAVQVVPRVARDAGHLYVFQRTPSSIGVRGNRPTDQKWAAALQPGWQQRRLDNFNVLTLPFFLDVLDVLAPVLEEFAAEDQVNDGWTEMMRSMVDIAKDKLRSTAGIEEKRELMGQLLEQADFQRMEQIRRRTEETVTDPKTAASLKAFYNQMCKRPCFHDEYLPAFNRRNVTLVDTDGRGVERVTPTGVVCGGVERAVDVLIFATGFEVGNGICVDARRLGFDIVGSGGRTLAEEWGDEVRTLFGIHSRGFPNLFVMGGLQAAYPVNFVHGLLEQSAHIAAVVREGVSRGVRSLEPSEEAQRDWIQTCIRLAGDAFAFQEACTPGYYNHEGRPERKPQNARYGGGSVNYFKVLRDWRGGGMRGMEFAS